MSDFPAAFEEAFDYLLKNEGVSFSQLAGDPGGRTKYGITEAQYPDVDIAALTLDDAKYIYYAKPPFNSVTPFWVPLYDKILYVRVSTKIFDMAVNMGPGTAHEIVQEALEMKNPTQVFGPVTLGLVNNTNQNQLLSELCARSAVRYAEIYAKKPNAPILGWMRRAVRLPGQAL